MNQFSSCTDPLGPTVLSNGAGSMFSPTQSTTQSAPSSTLPFDYYSRYQSSSAGNGYPSSGPMVPYASQPAPSAHQSSYGNQYMSEYSNAYPQPCSMEYFRAKSTCATPATDGPYASIFTSRKYPLDFNNNTSSTSTAPDSDVKREQEERTQENASTEIVEPKDTNSLEPDTIEIIPDTDDEDYEDDEDDDPLDPSAVANIRTPIYLSPNCILYSYVGTDTLGAINDHFQRSFTMLFQNMRSTNDKSSTAGSEVGWNGGANGANGDLFATKNSSKFWSPQSYYSNYKDVQSQPLGGQLLSSVADTGVDSDRGSVDPSKQQQQQTSPSHTSHSQQSPLALKVKVLSGSSSSASPASVRASQSCHSGGSNPVSPKENRPSSKVDEELDPNSGALVVAGYNQSLRSAQYHRRYERRKRRYLKRLQLMHTPMLRRKLPISFWKFSAMFSCYYAGNSHAYSGANSYAVTPYMGNASNGYQLSPSVRAPQCQQMGSYGYAANGGTYGETQNDQAEVSTASYGQNVHQQHYENSNTASLLKNEAECHQVHHQASMSVATCAPQTYRPPLSLSVSMTIGGGPNASSQTPTTSSATHVTSSNASTTTTPTTSTSASTTSATAAAAAALATLNNDLTLDMSIHISPAIALGAAAAAGSAAPAVNPYRSNETASTAPLYHQNHSSYLGLLQSSLQSESYHHYYQYSSKFTATASNGSCQQGPGTSDAAVRPYAATYSAPNSGTFPENTGQSWGRTHAPYHHTAQSHYPSSFSQMMIAHRTSTAYSGYTDPASTTQADSTPELTYPPAAADHHHLSSYSSHPGYQSAHHQDPGLSATTSPFIAVAAAAAVRSYQDAMINGSHHHSGGIDSSAKLDTDTASSGSQLAASLYLQH